MPVHPAFRYIEAIYNQILDYVKGDLQMESNKPSVEVTEFTAAETTAANRKPGSKLSRQTLIVLVMTAFLSSMGMTIVFPVLPFIVEKYISNPDDLASTVGWLSSIYAICQFVAAPALGILSDRYGRRPILLICLIGSTLGYIIFGIGGALWVLILSRVVDGITGGDFSVLTAYVADSTEPEERGKFFGYFGAGAGAGFIVGPVIGGVRGTLCFKPPDFFFSPPASAVHILAPFFLPAQRRQKDNNTNPQI